MKQKPSSRRKPDLEHAKAAVLNSLNSKSLPLREEG
jgi:hypothetical protein